MPPHNRALGRPHCVESRLKRWFLLILLLLAAGFAPACQSLTRGSKRPAPAPADENATALAQALREFARDFRTTIDGAASQARQLDLTRAQRQAVTTWRVQAGNLLRHAFDQDDPREILLDVWSLCRRMQDYFEHGPGAAEFGPAALLAQAAAQDLLTRGKEIALAHVSPETLEQIRASVDEYARSHPLQPGFVAPPAQDLSDVAPGQSVLKWILDVPLAPLRGVEKMNQTSDAMRDISRTADRFTDVVSDFPATTRREALLLAEDLEQMPSVAATTQSVARIAASAEHFSKVVEDLPRRTREEAEQLLDRVDESHPQARATLGEARQTADAVRAAATELRELTAALDKTLAQFTEAGRAWSVTAEAVGATSRELAAWRKPADTQPATVPATSSADPVATTQPGFRLDDVTASAEALTRTTTELRGLVSDLQRLLASGAVSGEAGKLTAPAAEVLERAGLTSRALIDHAAWRAAQLLALLAALLLVYRWLTRVRPAGK